MKTIRIAEMDYTVDAVEDLRAEVILLRDKALETGEMKWAVVLSHVIAYMAVTKELLFTDGEKR